MYKILCLKYIKKKHFSFHFAQNGKLILTDPI